MMPHQIYCDYLEDKGVDCRLLRIEESNTIITNFEMDFPFNEDGYGDGISIGNGLGDGWSFSEYESYYQDYFFHRDHYSHEDYGYDEGYSDS